MASPLLDALSTRYPRIATLTAPFVQPVLWHPKRWADPFPLRKDRTPWAVMRHARELRAEGFGTCVLLNRSFRAALVARLAGIPRRVGHATEGRTFLLTHPVPFDEEKFEAYCSLDLARALGIDAPDVRPRLAITEAEIERGRELRADGSVGLQPGARFPEKQLPEAVLVEVARRLQREGRRLVLVGGKEEQSDAERLAAQLTEPVVDLVGRTSLRETLGVLAGLHAMVGADTGVMHLAAGVGCPTVTVFGPTPAQKWGHAYSPHRVLRAPEGKMANISAEAIAAGLSEVLETG
ncbi:MAG: glycosyltransferase family 9 protein [Fimbriimonas sp.]